jgi:TrmH family RNA methyltransferase
VADQILPISSGQNPRFKQALKLRQRRARDKQQRILIDGQREIEMALSAGVQVQEVFVDAKWLHEPPLELWLGRCIAAGASVLTLPTTLLAKLGYGDRHDQCVATARLTTGRLSELRLPVRPLVAVLEGVEKPGNVGAVVRSADAAGVDAVIVANGRTDVFNPNAIRASRGTLFTTPVCVAAVDEVVEWLEGLRLQVCVARVDATLSYEQCDLRQGTVIVLGSEAKGVSGVWRAERYRAIKLPMAGHADSLNVAVTAAILFYEARRQRHVDALTQSASPRPPTCSS